MKLKMDKKELKKHGIIVLLITFIYVLFAVNLYQEYIVKGKVCAANEETEKVTEKLRKSDEICQPFSPKEDSLNAIVLYFATMENVKLGEGTLRLQLLDMASQKVLAETKLDTRTIYDNEKFTFAFDSIDVSKKEPALRIQVEELSDKATLYLYTSKKSEEVAKPMSWNKKASTDYLRLSYRYDAFGHAQKVLLGAIILFFVFLMALYYLIMIRRCNIQWVYLCAVLLLGCIYMMLVPEYMTPDEDIHITKAIEVSNSLLGYRSEPEDFEMRSCEWNYIKESANRYQFNAGNYNYYYESLWRGDGNEELVSTTRRVMVVPRYQYYLSGLGITIGRLIHLNAVKTFVLGMLFNFAFYVLATWLAIRLIPFGKAATAILCLLPISLQQATSYSYDCIVIPLGILFVAILFKILYEDSEKANKKLWIGMAAVTALFLPTKQFAYIGVLLLLLYGFAISFKRNKKLAWRLLLISGIGIIAAAGIQVLATVTTPQAAKESLMDVPYIEWARQPAYTIKELLQKPLDTLQILWNTVYVKGDYYIHSTFGGSLGNLMVNLSEIAIMIFFTALFLTAMPKKDEKAVMSPAGRIVCFAVFLICVACAAGGMLLGWTPVSYDFVEGVQGRYFLPVLLLAFFALRGKGICISEKVEKICMYAVMVAQVFVLPAIAWQI